MKTISSALAAAALIATTPALAQDQWAQQVQKYMDAAAERLSDSGFSYGGYTHAGSLDAGADESLTVRLGTNNSQFVAMCDNDCSDIDLTLYDADGDKVSEDVQADDYPVVGVSPNKNGVYTLKVHMETCSSEPCRYAVQQFVK